MSRKMAKCVIKRDRAANFRYLLLGVFIGMTIVTYSAWTGETLSTTLYPADLFWRMLGAACALIVLFGGYSVTKRDAVLERVSLTVFGSELVEGIVTRVSVIENNCDVCQHAKLHHSKR